MFPSLQKINPLDISDEKEVNKDAKFLKKH